MLERRSAGSQVASFLPKFLHFIKYSVFPISDENYLLDPCAPGYSLPQTFPQPFFKAVTIFDLQLYKDLAQVYRYLYSTILIILQVYFYLFAFQGQQIIGVLISVNLFYLQSIMSCSRNYFRNQNGECQPCSFGCVKCYVTTNCISCTTDFLLQNGSCKYSSTLPSELLTMILIIVAVAIFMLYCLIFFYLPYLNKKRKQNQLEAMKLVSPFRIVKKISQESVERTPPELQPETTIVCPLCLKPEINVRTQCGHIFHQACLLDWTLNEQTCPTCKNPTIYPLKFYCLQCKSIYEGMEGNVSESAKDLVFHQCRKSFQKDKEDVFR